MKTLLILRHAKSSWSNANLGDHDRPLNERGKRDAPRVGRLLRREGLVPDLILCSSAERALATAEAVALESGYEQEIQVTRALYHGGPEHYLAALRQLPDVCSRVMVVGHNPGLEELLESLTGNGESMPTGALAQVELPIARWSAVVGHTAGRLVDFWVPRDLPD
jgi:phosphohistidine phosphatase